MPQLNSNTLERMETTPWSNPTNANVADAQKMTSPEAEAARARSEEIMAALRKGDKGEADKLMGENQNHDSLLPGMAKLKGMLLGGKKKEEKVIR